MDHIYANNKIFINFEKTMKLEMHWLKLTTITKSAIGSMHGLVTLKALSYQRGPITKYMYLGTYRNFTKKL
jgi:hypothetical protein